MLPTLPSRARAFLHYFTGLNFLLYCELTPLILAFKANLVELIQLSHGSTVFFCKEFFISAEPM